MARKSSSKSPRGAGRKATKARTRSSSSAPTPLRVDPRDLSRMAKVLTPKEAFDLYRANARMALDVIDAAIEGTSRLRKLQFEGEEEARSMQKKAARQAAEASDAQSLVAAGQAVTQEAVEKAMQYWSQMFDMIVEVQKRLFTLMEQQMAGMPGAGEAKAALALMPDLTQTKDLVKAMQGVMSSGGSAFGSMQRVMSDWARIAQQSIPSLAR
jgi:phasin family protein